MKSSEIIKLSDLFSVYPLINNIINIIKDEEYNQNKQDIDIASFTYNDTIEDITCDKQYITDFNMKKAEYMLRMTMESWLLRLLTQ